MKIMASKQILPTAFDSDTVKGVEGRVLIGKADGAANFCMRLFQVAENGFTPRHQHAWEHEVFIHAGHGAVFLNGRWTAIETGDTVYVPPGEEHQFKNTGDVPLMFICVIPAQAPEL